MGVVGSIGVLKLRQLVNILLFERQRALIVELQLTERPFHIVGNQTHSFLLFQNGCGASAMRTA